MTWLIQQVPSISTPFALGAFLAAALLYLINYLINAIKGLSPAERKKIVEIIGSGLDRDYEKLTSEQYLELRKLLANQKHRRRMTLALVVVTSLGTGYVLNKIFPEQRPAAAISPPATPTATPQNEQPGSQAVDRLVGPKPQNDTTKLPFTIRMIEPDTLNDEPATDGEVTVTDSRPQIPNRLTPLRGQFFIEINEAEKITIHIAASLGGQRVERTIVISGHVAAQVPCEDRTIYLPKKPFTLTKELVRKAYRSLRDTSRCASIDKALVVWQAIQETLDQTKSSNLPPYVKDIGDLIEYSRAVGKYQACTSLGYEPECEIGDSTFKNPKKISLRGLGIGQNEQETMSKDISSFPLRMAYSRLQKLFSIRDYSGAANMAEELIRNFDVNSQNWEHVNISKSRLHADAAVSWLHYGDSLASSPDFGEDDRRCAAYRKSLLNTQQAQWQNFRQEHLPGIIKRVKGCV